MARHHRDIKIEAEGRDKGKTFRLWEMSATDGEEWGLRAVNGIARAGVAIPDELRGIGMAAIALLGFRAFMGMAWVDLKPLSDQLLARTKILMPAAPEGRDIGEDDIEEIATRTRLKLEAFDLHTGFFTRAGVSISTLWDQIAAAGTASSKSPTSPE